MARILKTNSILNMVNGMIIDLPSPVNLSYFWNFGSLLGMCLVIQIVTGIFLAMHYAAHIDIAFDSVEHIMRDVNYGWLLRYLHANGASMFFLCIYIHIARGLYYGSYTKPRILLWSVGVVIFLVQMGVGFIGYVLPWGQMSFWGATVITNMVSAIPLIGLDLVQWVWGGFYTIEEPRADDGALKILLIAGTSLLLGLVGEVIYDLAVLCIGVKKITTWGQSAGVKETLSFEASQRLNARNLTEEEVFPKGKDYTTEITSLWKPYLVGLIEGDGWFSMSKKGEDVQYELGIEMGKRDVQLAYKLKKMLGVGRVEFRKKQKGEDAVFFRIRDKKHLINVILPIFDEYPLLSNKHYDYLIFKQGLLADIKYYGDLPDYTRPSTTRKSSLGVPYFTPWLIGFIEAEGCFSVYQPNKNSSRVASFDIGQTGARELIEDIAIHLSVFKKITVDHTNCAKLEVASVRHVENIIKFMQNAPIQLLGYKKLQYLLWLKKLRQIPRYNTKFKIPTRY